MGKVYANLTKLIGSLSWTKKVSFLHQNLFSPVLTGNAFKHCMFELILQIGFYDQNLVRKNLIYSEKYIFLSMEPEVYYNTIWFYTFSEHILVFLCKIQYTLSVLYTQPN